MGSLKKVLHSSYPGGKKNPYSNPHHPNHDPKPSPGTNTFRPTAPPRRPASPRGSSDFLAEARAAVGRDRVTGRRVNETSSNPTHPFPSNPDSNPNPRSEYQAYRPPPLTSTPVPRPAPQEDAENSAFNARNEGVRQTTGTRYDLFVQEMKDRKLGGFRAPGEGYYAPAPRQATEYYAPEARLGFGNTSQLRPQPYDGGGKRHWWSRG